MFSGSAFRSLAMFLLDPATAGFSASLVRMEVNRRGIQDAAFSLNL